MPYDSEFGLLLTIGLKSIGARENLSQTILKENLGDELGLSSHAIQKWQQGQIPRDPGCVSFLAEESVIRGGCDIRWLRRFLARGKHPQPDRIIKKLFSRADEPMLQIRHNLRRPEYSTFVGRKEVISRIKDYLSLRYRHGVVCISGQGGVGKTALAQMLAHYYKDSHLKLDIEDRFDVVLYISAKPSELSSSGISHKYPLLTDLDSIFRALAVVHEDVSILQNETLDDKIINAIELLSRHRTLLILDNMETVDDQYLLNFLQDLPDPSKALITTRHRLDVAMPVHLTNLTQEEGKKLIEIEAEERKIVLTEDEYKTLIEVTSCMPLAIIYVLKKMQHGGSRLLSVLEELQHPNSEYYEFIFAPSIKLIRKSVAFELFLGLYFFPGGATRNAIGWVADLDDNHYLRDKSLEELVVLCLVDKVENRFFLNDLTRIYVANELKKSKEFDSTVFIRLVGFYEQWLQEVNTLDYQDQKAEMLNIIVLMIELEKRGEIARLVWFFQKANDLLNIYGYWDERLAFVETLVSWAESKQDWALVTKFFPMYVTSIHNWERLSSKAPGWVKKGEVWSSMIEDSPYAYTLNAHLCYCDLRVKKGQMFYDPVLKNEPEKRISVIEIVTLYAQRIYPIYLENKLFDFLMSTLYETGSLLCDEKMYREANAYYKLAWEELEKLSNNSFDKKKWRAVISLGQSLVIARQGNHKEACKKITSIIPELIHIEDIIMAHICLSYYERESGNFDISKAHLAHVREIRDHYNIPTPICLEERWWLEEGEY